MTDLGMKCSRCQAPARHRLPAHNARFCDPCLDRFARRQVERAIKQFHMLAPGQGVLVAVSGGKDSLSAWRILKELGYAAEGLHLSLELGAGEFSAASLAACRAMSERLEAPLHVYRLEELAGVSVEEVARANRRAFCSICGTLKRYYLNRLSLELGFAVVASGHHLDDEAGRLLGNLIHRHQQYLQGQWPTLAGVPGRFARKIKPLCRLSGREIKAYAQVHGLPIAQGHCPRSKGATLPYYQEAVQLLEERMPGTTRALYLGFLEDKGAPPPLPDIAAACAVCGAPTYAEVCTTCRFLERARRRREDQVNAAETSG